MGNAEHLISLLCALNISAMAAYPNRRMPRMDQAVVMVGVTEQSLQPLALHGEFDTAAQTFSGALAYEETVQLELYSPYLFGGSHCDQTADTILRALAQAFTALSLSSVTREATYYDADTDCFRCRLRVVTKAYLTATEG